MLRVTPFYVYGVSNPGTAFRPSVGVFESRGTVLYGVRLLITRTNQCSIKSHFSVTLMYSFITGIDGEKFSLW